MPSPVRFGSVLGIWLTAAVTAITSASSASARSSRDCLGDETFFVARFPGLQAYLEAIGERTKLGELIRDPRFSAAFKKFLFAESDGKLDQWMGQLAELGFDESDLSPLVRGELGYAGTLHPRDDKMPVYVGLAWSECGAETADKLLAAVDRFVERHADAKFPIRREDLDLAGVQVRHLMLPLVGPPQGNLQLGLSLNTRKGIDVVSNVDRSDADENDTLQGFAHLLLCEQDGRLLAAHTIGPYLSNDADGPADNASADIELVREVFGRFLAAHSDEGEGTYYRWMQTPGLQGALPEGLPLVEIVADLRHGMKWALTQKAPVTEFLQAGGLDSLGTVAYRSTLDGTIVRGGIFVAMPAPRAGLLQLFDQRPIAPQPPDWVSDDVLGYQHVSFDFGKAYRLVTDLLRKSSEDERKQLDEFETQIQEFLQIAPADLLSSLGDVHSIVSLVPERADRDADPEAASTSMAVVWNIDDDTAWRRLMTMAATASETKIDEVGDYRGLRWDEAASGLGWYLADRKMFVAIGKGTTDRVLAMLRTAPAARSLRASASARRAAELLPPRDGLTFELANGPSALKLVNSAIVATLDAKNSAAAKELRAAWPSDDAIDGVVGVNTSATTIDEHGITYRSAAELPPP